MGTMCAVFPTIIIIIVYCVYYICLLGTELPVSFLAQCIIDDDDLYSVHPRIPIDCPF